MHPSVQNFPKFLLFMNMTRNMIMMSTWQVGETVWEESRSAERAPVAVDRQLAMPLSYWVSMTGYAPDLELDNGDMQEMRVRMEATGSESEGMSGVQESEVAS